MVILNKTGIIEDTQVAINGVNFRIDQDVFALSGLFKNLTGNTQVDAKMKGTLNLANLEKAYPIQLDQKVSGIFIADVSTSFDMKSLEKEAYENIKTSGVASLQKFEYTTPELPNPINIDKAKLAFTPALISLQEMNLKTGKSDILATGDIKNLIGFMVKNQELKGDFNVHSDYLDVADFMTSETNVEAQSTEASSDQEGDTSSSTESLKIPDFLNANLAFDAKKVKYDNIILENTKGDIGIEDQTVYLKKVSSDVFGGSVVIDGKASTKEETPVFDMGLDLQKIDIAKSFTSMDVMKAIAPIAKGLVGTLNTNLSLKGNLDQEFAPVLSSLKGNALAQILGAKVAPNQTPLLSKLDQKIEFLNLKNIRLNDIKTKLAFENGNINVAPFTFNVQGIDVTAKGSHKITNEMDYKLNLNIPAKYLGKEAGSVISKLGKQQMDAMMVNVPLNISGNFTNPSIDLKTGDAVKNLTQQIVSAQKNQLKGKVKDTGKQLLSGILGGSKTDSKDTSAVKKDTKKNLINDAKSIFGGFLNKKSKKKGSNDSSNE